MAFYKGTEFEISPENKLHFKSAKTLKIIEKNDSIVQFTFGEGESKGTMPVQHLEYLLKRKELTQIDSVFEEDYYEDNGTGVIGQI